jgi:CheY-like chemotaxis protein
MEYTVLVVDDSKLARMVVAGILGRAHPSWRVLEASNGEQALRSLESEAVDIVLIDFNMPDMDGLALAARLRETRRNMPMALVSANAQDAILARARELDVTFLEKPLTDATLTSFLSGATLRLRRAGA